MSRKFSDNRKPGFKTHLDRKQNKSIPTNINFNKTCAKRNAPAANTNRLAANGGAKGVLLQVNCWKFKGPHYARDCPNKTDGVLHNLQEDPTIEYMASTPRIYAALDDRQVNHQATVVEIEGKVSNTSISILINLGACRSYVSPKIVEMCKLNKEKHEKSWLVQLATGTKRKVSELVNIVS